jgi:hypothetical protein
MQLFVRPARSCLHHEDLVALAWPWPGPGMLRHQNTRACRPRICVCVCVCVSACCYGQLGNNRKGLEALAACLETGYSQFGQIRSDPDLAPLRADDRFEGLIVRFEGSGFFKDIVRGFSR